MLSPRYLDGLSDELAEIYSQLETDILTDMARRIARLGKVTDATKWQAQMLAEAGGLKRNIPRLLSKYDKAVANQVIKAFDDALKTNTKNDNKIFKAATGRTVSAPNAQAMLSTIQKCHSDLSRLTLTTAATSQEQFVQQANRSFMDVMSGAFDYDTAMKNAADELSDEGIRTVQYENGKPVRRSIESAVRMNIITSINQTAANQTLNNCEELGCDLVETSAHIGARPEHEDWQGEVFSLSGANKKYRPFSVCGLGTPTGICGINCRHSYYPYFEEMDEHYTQDDLDEMSAEKVTYTDGNGEERELSRYEGEQKLRGIERKIRFYKKRALTEEAAGADNTASRQKLGEWQSRARTFTEQTGIRRDYAREYVGTKGEQPRGIAAVVKENSKTQTNKETPFVTGGSFGGVLDKSDEEQVAYAKRAYEEIRKKNAESDIAKVAKSSGLTKEEVAKVRNHLFIDKHQLEKGFVRFDESAEIANAWEALEQGRAKPLDIMLIKHELEELTIMEKYGYDYDVAHLMANRKYPWEYKKRGGYTDDDIQASINERLETLLQSRRS